MENVRIELCDGDGPRRVEPILRSVPEWFGIEESTRAYVEASGRMPTFVAWVTEHAADPDAGFITIERHFEHAAEVHCMAVHRDFHGRGIGTALLRHAEHRLSGSGVRLLQVKTQGPSKPSAEYARTLHFYESRGFTRLEEVRGLWPGIPCLILVKSIGAAHP
ncbi:MAG: GNAT family N-acetyltransferase [Phycisphaerales bacterium]